MVTDKQEIIHTVVIYSVETSVSQNYLNGIRIEKPLNIVTVADFFAK